MRIVTGNDLRTGAVLWWAQDHWSQHVEDAVDATGLEDGVIAREEAARRINAAYAIDAELFEGTPRPAHIKDRIRALGPTVRPDLTLKPADPAAGSWVI